MWNTLRAFTIAGVALVFAFPAGAQQGLWSPAPVAVGISPAQSVGVNPTSGTTAAIPGPTRASLAFPVSASTTPSYVPSVEMREPSRRNTALMIVGGAGLLVGAIVGGDEGSVIMIAGGGVGLWGLWRHLS